MKKKKYTASDLPELLQELQRLREVEERYKNLLDLIEGDYRFVIETFLETRKESETIRKIPISPLMRENMIRLGIEPPED